MSSAADHSLNEEAPNELIINRRSLLSSGIGLLLVPVTGLLGSASAQGPKNINAFNADKLLYDFSKVCRVATQAEVGPYYIDKALMRSDIRDGQKGRPLTLNFKIVDANARCRPVKGAVVSIWHCNARGEYSGYIQNRPNELPEAAKFDSHGHATETDVERFLRGAQVTDDSGTVAFTTVFPGWYTPRAVHIHVRVYLNEHQLLTSQVYFPQAVVNHIQTTDAAYKDRGVGMFTNEGDFVRRKSGISGDADVLTVNEAANGTLVASWTLGAADTSLM